MFSKVWDSVLVVSWWLSLGLFVYFVFTEGFTDRCFQAMIWCGWVDHMRRIEALEKKQESQAS